MQFSADHLQEAKHTNELKVDENKNYLHIDAAILGLGGGSCGPVTLEPYQVMPETTTLSYLVRPVKTTNTESMAELARANLDG